MKSYNTLILERKESILKVIFNRPEKMNACNDEMASELVDFLLEVNQEEDIRVIIFTGAGKAFCSGADIKDRFLPKIKMRKEGLLKDVTNEFSEIGAIALSRLRKVTIAEINGVTAGVGLSFAIGCDIRIAASNAKFIFPFVPMGLLPEFGLSYYLPRLIGIGKACELIFTGANISAEEAKQIGLVNRIVPLEKLSEEVWAFAEKIIKMPPLSVMVSKRVLYQGMRASDLWSQLQYEALALVHLFGTADHEEATKAFIEKRDPHFKGK